MERLDGASSAWMQTDKMWGTRDRPLKVHFLNSEVLEEKGWMCGDAPMNVDNVLAWAQQWNSNAFPAIPKFDFTNSAKIAHIRVHFGGKCAEVKYSGMMVINWHSATVTVCMGIDK